MKYLCLLITILLLQSKLYAQEYMHELICIYHIGMTDRPHFASLIYVKGQNPEIINNLFYYIPVKEKTYRLIKEYIVRYKTEFSDTAVTHSDWGRLHGIDIYKDTTITLTTYMHSEAENFKFFTELYELLPDTRRTQPLKLYIISELFTNYPLTAEQWVILNGGNYNTWATFKDKYTQEGYISRKQLISYYFAWFFYWDLPQFLNNLGRIAATAITGKAIPKDTNMDNILEYRPTAQ